MKKVLIGLSLVLLIISSCFVFTGCSGDTPSIQIEKSEVYSLTDLQVGDPMFEGFEVVKVNKPWEVSSIKYYSYEVVDLNSGVVYLYTIWFRYTSSGYGGQMCSMTPLYNPDGTLRMYTGN